LILDVDTGRINAVDSFLVKLLGFSSNEMVGKTGEERAPFTDIELNKARLDRFQRDSPVRYKEHPGEGVAT
jgi:hypothetical protein